MTLDPSVRTAMLAAMPKLRAFAISLCRNGDHAEDLVQDTLLRVRENHVIHSRHEHVGMAVHDTEAITSFRNVARGADGPRRSTIMPTASLPSRCRSSMRNTTSSRRHWQKLGPTQREVIVMIGACGIFV